MSVNQFGSVETEFKLLKFKTQMYPLYIVYKDRGQTKNRVMFFMNQVDVCLLFYRGTINREHLVNFDANLRKPDLKNVKFYNSTKKSEVFYFLKAFLELYNMPAYSPKPLNMPA
jgi:hypothetical protein